MIDMQDCLACFGSQSEHMIRFILPTHGASGSHIIKQTIAQEKDTYDMKRTLVKGIASSC